MTPEELAEEEARMAKQGDFNIERLLKQMKSLLASMEMGKTDIDEYVAMLIEWTKSFKHLGSAISIAFKDIVGKANTVRDNKKQLIVDLKLAEEGSDEHNFLQSFVALEKAQNCQHLNGDDNKKCLKKYYKKDEIKDWFKLYNSTSRNLYRNCWFMEFVAVMYTEFVATRGNPKTKMSGLGQASYKKALAPHHPWVL